MSKVLQTFKQKIGYTFRDDVLLETALRHRSCGKSNNERLEFLGDSILNFVVAGELFKHFPEAKEGKLSRLRANLVNEGTLAELARTFDFGSVICLGHGEAKSGGRMRASILADCIEAVIGAVYLDSDLENCYTIVANWYKERIQGISLSDTHKDPKSLLQELLQAKQLPLPQYRLVDTVGVEHNQVFVVAGEVALLDHSVTAEGSSRRKAEQAVASRILEELGHG